MSASMQDLAPASVAISSHPARTLEEAREKMGQWSEQIRLMQDLMAREDVSLMDKQTLGLEMATAKVCLLACANIVTACEERMREQAKRLEERWGWLL